MRPHAFQLVALRRIPPGSPARGVVPAALRPRVEGVPRRCQLLLLRAMELEVPEPHRAHGDRGLRDRPAAGYLSLAPKAHHRQPVRESRRARLLQVRELPHCHRQRARGDRRRFARVEPLDIILPVGISFYTFQSDELHDRRLPPPSRPRDVAARLRGLRRVLPAARRRADRARVGVLRPQLEPPAARLELRDLQYGLVPHRDSAT